AEGDRALHALRRPGDRRSDVPHHGATLLTDADSPGRGDPDLSPGTRPTGRAGEGAAGPRSGGCAIRATARAERLHRRALPMTEHERAFIGIGSVLVFLLVWEAVTLSRLVDPLFLSSPTLIARAGYELFAEGTIWKDLRVSGTEFVIGYLLAAGVAIPLGLAVGWYRRLYFCLSPFIDILNAVPRVALLPIIIIWFGIGVWSKVVVVFLGAVIPMLLNTLSGGKTTEERRRQVAQSKRPSGVLTPESV